ncbi:ATPase [Desulfolucanica intricata]|uniref:ATPase n=1 Tax=Desulfolucanica intricata TaxID=1285191 RepID=UPI00082A6F8A|nr:ATPase [Desulfolucanica intricata]
MELFNVINELEELIESSPKIPMTKKVLVDEDRVLDFLDRIRAVLPEEVRQAKWVVQEREKVLLDTKKEANRLMEDAKSKILMEAEQSEVVKQAQKIAEEIMKNAENVAVQIKEGARDYADDILKELEETISKHLTEIQQGRVELQGLKKEAG